MKTEKVIGIVWLIFSLIYFYQGLDYLYLYSTPGLLWTFMIPIVIAYTKIICGILSFLIGIKFIKGKSENNYLILPLSFLLIIYLVIHIIQYGISTIYYSGENILLLILIVISFHKYKTQISITTLAENLKEKKISIIGILILGFIPYLLAELTTYSFYKFLH